MRNTGGVTGEQNGDDDEESSDDEKEDDDSEDEVSDDEEEDEEEEKAEVLKVETVMKTEPGFEHESNAARFRREYEERYVAELARSRSQVYGSSGYARPGAAYYLPPPGYGGFCWSEKEEEEDREEDAGCDCACTTAACADVEAQEEDKDEDEDQSCDEQFPVEPAYASTPLRLLPTRTFEEVSTTKPISTETPEILKPMMAQVNALAQEMRSFVKDEKSWRAKVKDELRAPVPLPPPFMPATVAAVQALPPPPAPLQPSRSGQVFRGIRMEDDGRDQGGAPICGRCQYLGHGRVTCRQQSMTCRNCNQLAIFEVSANCLRPHSKEYTVEGLGTDVNGALSASLRVTPWFAEKEEIIVEQEHPDVTMSDQATVESKNEPKGEKPVDGTEDATLLGRLFTDDELGEMERCAPGQEATGLGGVKVAAEAEEYDNELEDRLYPLNENETLERMK
ncbi:unnamed protein product [Phytophthora lilii]|uniref:Unnamed protein product n=1 Tax=Phytophthora lilii TaxID=2077276 RepID=A0A9W6TZE2_9STRA|nr:unnamed protein product [Phytophthora lilii]